MADNKRLSLVLSVAVRSGDVLRNTLCSYMTPYALDTMETTVISLTRLSCISVAVAMGLAIELGSVGCNHLLLWLLSDVW